MITYFISFRTQPKGGGVNTAQLYAFDDTGPSAAPSLKPVDWSKIGALAGGRAVVFATHGFNVNQAEGVRSLSRLSKYLDLQSPYLFIGILWPGDFWIPAINYPLESADANKCGVHLADCCHEHLASAADYIFFSHSLGARVMLSAVARLHKPAKVICLTAGAVDRDCLLNEFEAARDNAQTIQVLASKKDWVLRAAYPIGDVIADILDKDDALFRGALGRKGPAKPQKSHVYSPWQIPKSQDYGHGNYLPSSNDGDFLNHIEAQPEKVAEHLRRAISGQPQTWPPPS